MIRPFVYLLSASVLLGSLPAGAADFSANDSAAPHQRWSGCHVSLQGGYDTIDTKFVGAGAAHIKNGQRASEDGGFGIGGGGGCDWQSGSWVFGLLGDGTTAGSSDYPVESDWFASVRGRIGYAQDRGLIFNVPTLWYLTAGVAWAGLEAENNGDQTATGWTVGWGSENAIDTRWSFKTETLYADYGEETLGGFKIDATAWVTRIGVSYKLTDW